MRVLFLSGVLDTTVHRMLLQNDKGSFNAAADTFQWNVIRGFEENGVAIDLLNSPFIGSYPAHHNCLLLYTKKWKHNEVANDIDVGYMNVFGLKQLLRLLQYRKQIEKWLWLHKSEKVVILAYGHYLPFIKAMQFAHKVMPDVKTAIILTDLPTQPSQNKHRNWMYYVASYCGSLAIKQFCSLDAYVFLTKQMSTLFKLEDRPYTIVEGIVNTAEVGNAKTKENAVLEVAYTGTLHEKYGIESLVAGFMSLVGNYTLIICGSGDYEEQLRVAATHDPRIQFRGAVSRDEALRIQRSADILVNPRSAEGEYTSCSFPSKTMEYLLSGTPVVCCHLPGIPVEYDSFLNYVADDSSEAFRRELLRILSLTATERNRMGEAAKCFVVKQKNCKHQVAKIIKLLEQ